MSGDDLTLKARREVQNVLNHYLQIDKKKVFVVL
jgi:hypothetical protein